MEIVSEKQIQGWIDDRFGIPNTVNAECFQDFAVWVIRTFLREGAREAVKWMEVSSLRALKE